MKTPITAEIGVSTTGFSLTTIKLSGARIMADSDNSRTLPPVTRGSNFHSFVAVLLPTNPELAVPFAALLEVDNEDFVFAIEREWRAVRQRLIESCLRGLGLEAKLLAMVGSPPHASEA